MEITFLELEYLDDDELDDLCREVYRRLDEGVLLGVIEREMLEERIGMIQEYKHLRLLRRAESLG